MRIRWLLVIVAIFIITGVFILYQGNNMTVTEAKEKHESRLLAIDGVAGVSADTEKKEIIVYVEASEVCRRIPSSLEGYPVKCKVTGRFEIR